MIKAVLFDVFGVLYPDTYWTIVRKYTHGAVSREQGFHELIGRVDFGLITRDEFWDKAADRLGITRRELDKEVKKLGSIDTELLAYAKKLRGQGYKTGIISNVGKGFIERIFEAHEPADYFDDMVLSSEVGLIKPDPNIYVLAADRLGVSPGQAIFVDDLEKNVAGARAVGMQALQYHSLQRLKHDIRPLLAPANLE